MIGGGEIEYKKLEALLNPLPGKYKLVKIKLGLFLIISRGKFFFFLEASLKKIRGYLIENEVFPGSCFE